MSPVETWGLSIWEAGQYKKWGQTFFDPPFDGGYLIREYNKTKQDDVCLALLKMELCK